LKKTLSIRSGAEAARPTQKSWGVSGERLERLKARARDERRKPTEAERLLWERISGGQVGGLKFHRKQLVGSVLTTFACPSRWVVINLSAEDGNPELDALQDKKLADTGIRVLRFAEAQVREASEVVIDAIKTEVNKPFDKRAAQRGAAGQFERSEG
jgi:very-short-patch-repair endonuclease